MKVIYKTSNRIVGGEQKENLIHQDQAEVIESILFVANNNTVIDDNKYSSLYLYILTINNRK